MNTALLKCTNLLVEKADYSRVHRKSAMLFNMLSRFGVVFKKSFDEAIIQVDELSHDECNYFTVKIHEAIKSEFKIDSDVRSYDYFPKVLTHMRIACHTIIQHRRCLRVILPQG